MAKYEYIPTDKNKALPGRDFEEQTARFLEDASESALWSRIVGRPGIATEDKAGLMDSEDKRDLQSATALTARLAAMHPDTPSAAPAWLTAPAGYLRHTIPWRSSASCLFPPEFVAIALGKSLFYCAGHPPFSLDNPENWLQPEYAAPVTRAGADCYFHVAVSDAETVAFCLSTSPESVQRDDILDSLLLGGFHCARIAIGDIPGHPLANLPAGGILPMSVWDLWHCPACAPAGMVYAPELRLWVDISPPAVPDATEIEVTELLARQSKRLLNVNKHAAALAGIGLENTGGFRGASRERYA